MSDRRIIDACEAAGIDRARLARVLDGSDNWGSLVHAVEALTVLGAVRAAMDAEDEPTPTPAPARTTAPRRRLPWVVVYRDPTGAYGLGAEFFARYGTKDRAEAKARALARWEVEMKGLTTDSGRAARWKPAVVWVEYDGSDVEHVPTYYVHGAEGDGWGTNKIPGGFYGPDDEPPPAPVVEYVGRTDLDQ